jgi:hypothetical protein
MVVKARDGRNIHGWHGLSGLAIYAFCMATAVSGFNALLPDALVWRGVVSVSGCCPHAGDFRCSIVPVRTVPLCSAVT